MGQIIKKQLLILCLPAISWSLATQELCACTFFAHASRLKYAGFRSSSTAFCACSTRSHMEMQKLQSHACSSFKMHPDIPN